MSLGSTCEFEPVLDGIQSNHVDSNEEFRKNKTSAEELCVCPCGAIIHYDVLQWVNKEQ